MRIATAVVSAAFIVASSEALAEPPWPNEYVLSNEIRTFPAPTGSEWLPRHLQIKSTRYIADLSTRLTRAEYETMMRETPHLISVLRHQVVGVSRITGWESRDHPCAVQIDVRDLDAGLAPLASPDAIGGVRAFGKCSWNSSSKKSTQNLTEDVFITGVKVCQSRKSYDNYRLKGVAIETGELGYTYEHGYFLSRAADGYKRTNCSKKGWQEEYYQCGRNEIVVGFDILWSQEETRDPGDIHLLLPICAPVISLDELR